MRFKISVFNSSTCSKMVRFIVPSWLVLDLSSKLLDACKLRTDHFVLVEKLDETDDESDFDF